MTKTLKQNKQALIYGLVLVALVIAYFKRDTIKDFFSKSGKSSSSNAVNAGTTTTTTKPPIVSADDNNTILKKGSSGKKVEKLQVLLNKGMASSPLIDFPALIVDGKFGAKTEILLLFLTGKLSISINQFLKYK